MNYLFDGGVFDCAWFDFNRENGGMVWVRVDLALGVTITLRSDEPDGCRTWTADEAEIAFDRRIEPMQLRQNLAVPYESDLGRALTRAFDRYVATESPSQQGRTT